MIAAKVANALALDWPRDRLEIVVAVDGGATRRRRDGRARARGRRRPRARAAARRQGARAGRRRGGRARDAARVLGRQRHLGAGRPARAVTPFADPGVGYVCGQVRFVNAEGTNQEGLYWRYEMWLRAASRRSRR